MNIIQKIFGTHSQNELKRVYPIADAVMALDEDMQRLSDEELKAKTKEFKDRLENGETLDDAIESANEAARDWITLELSEDDPLIPYVSDIEDIEVKEGEIVRNISMNIRFYEGWDE